MRILTILLLAAVLQTVQGANKHILPGHSTNGSGDSWSDPYNTWPTFVRGNTYYVADGTLSGKTFNTAASGTNWITIKKATASEHGSETGWSSAYGDGQFVFSSVLRFTTSYWEVDGVTGGGPENNWTNNFGFKISFESTYKSVRSGVRIDQPYVAVRHTHISGNANVNTAFFCYGFEAWDNVQNTTYSYGWVENVSNKLYATYAGLCEYVYFDRAYPWDGDSETGSFHVNIIRCWPMNGDVTIRYCYLTYYEPTGLVTIGGDVYSSCADCRQWDCYFYGNILDVYQQQDGGGGGAIRGFSGRGWHDRFYGFNNSFTGNKSTVVAPYEAPVNLFGSQSVIADAKWINNIFADSPAIGGIPGTAQYNSYYDVSNSDSGDVGFESLTSMPYLDEPNGDFSLVGEITAGTDLSAYSSSIPLLHAATETTHTFEVDMFGNTRGADGTWDRGAIEYTGDSGAGTIELISTTFSGSEDDATITITARRVLGTDGEATIDYATSNGTATAGSDYTAASGTLTWADGVSGNKTFTITITDDTDVESDETITVTLSNPTVAALNSSYDVGTVTLSDNDNPGEIQFVETTYEEDEDGGTVTLSVERVNGSDGAVGVSYASEDVTATAGSDYTGVSSTLAWTDGETGIKTIVITLADDSDVEGSETFTVTLSSPTGSATLGADSVTTVTITDDDSASATVPLMESLTFEAEDGLIELPFVSSGGYVYQTTQTAESASDGGLARWRFTIETEGTYTITCNVDAPNTGADSFFVAVDGNPSIPEIWDIQSLTTGSEARTVTIRGAGEFNDPEFNPQIYTLTTGEHTLYVRGREANAKLDSVTIEATADPGVIQFEQASYTVSEGGGAVVLTLERTVGTEGEVTVTYDTDDGTATDGVDYTGDIDSVTWTDGDGEDKSVVIDLIDNGDYVGGSKTFTVTLSNVTGDATLGDNTVATVTITDDEDAVPNAIMRGGFTIRGTFIQQ